MVLAHRLYDIIAAHRTTLRRSSPIPPPSLSSSDADPSPTLSADSPFKADPSSLKAPSKAMAESSASIDIPDTLMAALSIAPPLTEPESGRCASCQEPTICTFPPLQSAFASSRLSEAARGTPLGLEPKCTNWTTDYIGSVSPSLSLSHTGSRTLDYIFFSPECSVQSAHIYPLTVTGESSEDPLRRGDLPIPPSRGPYPNVSWPSDHLLLEATLRY
jgi:hypothetical protein